MTHNDPTLPAPRILRLRSVQAITGLSRSSIYALGLEGGFPRAIKISNRASGWSAAEVDAWVDAKLAGREWVQG
jgi:prophage regulatory protein